MSLSPELIKKFKLIAELISIETSMKLSSLVNRNVTMEYVGTLDSMMSVDKILVKKDRFLSSTQITNPELGPVSLIVSYPQVFSVSDLVLGGDGVADEKTKPDETNQMVYSETLNQVIKALFARFEEYSSGSELKAGNHEYKELISIKEASLNQPAGVEDSFAFTFKIKIAAKLDDIIHVEINSKVLEYVIEKIEPTLASINLEDFKNKIKTQYSLGTAEEKAKEVITEVEDSTDDSYKVDRKRNLSILTDISLDLVVELGRSEMMLSQLLKLTKGSAIELEKQSNEPVDLYAHNQLIARGEVVAIDDCFGLKITEILGDLKLAKKLGLSLK